MQEGILLILIVALFALAALFFGLFAVVWKIVAAMVRALASLFVGSDHRVAHARGRRRSGLTCTNELCRHVEYRDAAFCGQCGRRLIEP